MKNIFLSIIIPAFNEENRIEKCIDTVEKFFADKKYIIEIIIINDGSVDRTEIIIRYLAEKFKNIIIINRSVNKGKGFSVRSGMLQAKGKYALLTDADLSTPLSELEKALEYCNNGYDIVIGSRRDKDSKIKVYQPALRRLSGALFHVLRRILFLREIKDTQCGFKLFKKETINSIFNRQVINGFAFDVEVLLIAKSLNYKIQEMPVVWIDDKKTTLTVKNNIIPVLSDMLKLWVKNIRGDYK